MQRPMERGQNIPIWILASDDGATGQPHDVEIRKRRHPSHSEPERQSGSGRSDGNGSADSIESFHAPTLALIRVSF